MPKSSSKLKILYSEGDAEVLALQAVSIQKAGHEVIQAVGRKAVEAALRRESFDLVVLGPTLTKNDRHHLPYIVKKCQNGTRVLVMHTDGERHPCVDANLDTGSRFETLLEKIAALHGVGQCWSNSLARLRVSRAAHELPCLPNEFAEHSLVRAARVNKWTVARDFADPGAKQTTR